MLVAAKVSLPQKPITEQLTMTATRIAEIIFFILITNTAAHRRDF